MLSNGKNRPGAGKPTPCFNRLRSHGILPVFPARPHKAAQKGACLTAIIRKESCGTFAV